MINDLQDTLTADSSGLQVDEDENEIAGLKTPQVTVPLATRGWNPRDLLLGARSEMFSMKGSYFPFSRTKSEREQRGDPRPSVAERYSRRDYVMIDPRGIR